MTVRSIEEVRALVARHLEDSERRFVTSALMRGVDVDDIDAVLEMGREMFAEQTQSAISRLLAAGLQ